MCGDTGRDSEWYDVCKQCKRTPNGKRSSGHEVTWCLVKTHRPTGKAQKWRRTRREPDTHVDTNRQFFGQGLSALGPILRKLKCRRPKNLLPFFLGIIFIGILADGTCCVSSIFQEENQQLRQSASSFRIFHSIFHSIQTIRSI